MREVQQLTGLGYTVPAKIQHVFNTAHGCILKQVSSQLTEPLDFYYGDRLVTLMREVQQLTGLGYTVPAKIQHVFNTAHDCILKQVSSQLTEPLDCYYGDRLVTLMREVRQLTGLGYTVPGKIQHVFNTAHGCILKQVSSQLTEPLDCYYGDRLVTLTREVQQLTGLGYTVPGKIQHVFNTAHGCILKQVSSQLTEPLDCYYGDRLVTLMREVQQLTGLGYTVPAKIQHVFNTAHGCILKQVSSQLTEPLDCYYGDRLVTLMREVQQLTGLGYTVPGKIQHVFNTAHGCILKQVSSQLTEPLDCYYGDRLVTLMREVQQLTGLGYTVPGKIQHVFNTAHGCILKQVSSQLTEPLDCYYGDRLVTLMREVQQLTGLGYTVPAKIQHVFNTAHGCILKQVSSQLTEPLDCYYGDRLVTLMR